MNNFYNEPRVARSLAELVGQQGSMPKAWSTSMFEPWFACFLPTQRARWGFAADPIYLDLLSRFDTGGLPSALRSFADPEIASQLQFARWPSINVAISSRNSGVYF